MFATIRIPVRAVSLHANVLADYVGTQVWHSPTADEIVVTGPFHIVDEGKALLTNEGDKIQVSERQLGFFWKPLGAVTVKEPE